MRVRPLPRLPKTVESSEGPSMNTRTPLRPFLAALVVSCAGSPLLNVSGVDVPTESDQKTNPTRGDIEGNADLLLKEGRATFRDDTFGSEQFWGGQLGLHKAIAGEAHGGVGPGLTPKQALNLGLKVDAGKLGKIVLEAIKGGSLDLNDPAMTLELLRAGAVVGVRGVFDDKKTLTSVGITCALCHSTVDDKVTVGIGSVLDGWPNRDLDVGNVILLAPNLQPLMQLAQADEVTLRKVLSAWGPGKYDAELTLDGNGFRPDGKSASTVIPAAFGLAGVNLHTYTGWGSVSYWNAYVATTQMHGSGTFFDPRLKDATRFSLAVKNGSNDVRDRNDLVTSKLGGLHLPGRHLETTLDICQPDTD